MVHTEEGEIFVPGQTIENEYGEEYAPGITINVDNKPTLLSGLIMGEEEKEPMFLPSQSTITADGQLTFASVPEERSPPQPEGERKLKRRNKKKEAVEPPSEEFILVIEEDALSETDEKSTDTSSIEMNNSEMEEIDIEAIRLKQEQRQLELEQLKLILMDDGMDGIIASLEEKKAQLNKKLEELRRLSLSAENNLVSYVNESDAWEVASKITEDKDAIIRISDILLTMTRRAATFRDKNNVQGNNINTANVCANATEMDEKFNACSAKMKVLFKSALVGANDVFKNRPKDQMLALNCIADILTDPLKTDGKLLREFVDSMNTPFERNEICSAAFKQLTYNREDTKTAALDMIANQNVTAPIEVSVAKRKNAKTDEDAENVLQKCIVKATKSWLDRSFEALKDERKENRTRELIEEAASFAKALDLEDVAEDVAKLKIPLRYNSYIDAKSTDLLKRLILIRALAERDYSLKSAIERIKKNPVRARTDPRIHQIIRESAVLISSLSTVRNSRDVPLQLMKTQNILAIEDFLLKKCKFDHPVLISRGNLQAVVPKEAARGVLAGRIPYVLIDESGVTNFRPMHMMSAMQVNRNRERRIDDYLSGVRERSSDRDDARAHLQPKSNVRKMFNNYRQVA
ncbi:hypothetical protein NQ317_001870 [Molorchus minor]|uniref:Uncharacterized protein n=1 Tax=Molorchus minor TaxID=1323400 RepID=A0ABQ9JXQ1_9CUCU|nr:hypothetical protein NQ317_001870 [Molorchus minor]